MLSLDLFNALYKMGSQKSDKAMVFTTKTLLKLHNTDTIQKTILFSNVDEKQIIDSILSYSSLHNTTLESPSR